MKVKILSKSGDHNAVYDYPTIETTGQVLKHILEMGYYYDGDRNAVPATEIRYIRMATDEEYRSS